MVTVNEIVALIWISIRKVDCKFSRHIRVAGGGLAGGEREEVGARGPQGDHRRAQEQSGARRGTVDRSIN